jgi:hypothetical protein
MRALLGVMRSIMMKSAQRFVFATRAPHVKAQKTPQRNATQRNAHTSAQRIAHRWQGRPAFAARFRAAVFTRRSALEARIRAFGGGGDIRGVGIGRAGVEGAFVQAAVEALANGGEAGVEDIGVPSGEPGVAFQRLTSTCRMQAETIDTWVLQAVAGSTEPKSHAFHKYTQLCLQTAHPSSSPDLCDRRPHTVQPA